MLSCCCCQVKPRLDIGTSVWDCGLTRQWYPYHCQVVAVLNIERSLYYRVNRITDHCPDSRLTTGSKASSLPALEHWQWWASKNYVLWNSSELFFSHKFLHWPIIVHLKIKMPFSCRFTILSKFKIVKTDRDMYKEHKKDKETDIITLYMLVPRSPEHDCSR